MILGSWNAFGRLAFVASLGLALAVPATPPRARKLNGPLVRTNLADVRDFRFVPGDERILYVADPDIDETFELYSRVPGGTARANRLHAPFRPWLQVQPGFMIDDGGRRVVFQVRVGSVGNRYTTLSVPADGSAPPLAILPASLTFPQQLALAPHGDRLLYLGTFNLLESVPTDRVEPPVVLSPPGAPATNAVTEFRFTSDGRHVVYIATSLFTPSGRLYVAPIDGSAPPVQLNRPAGRIVNVSAFAIAPDGQSVVFRAQHSSSSEESLYRASFSDGATSERLTPDLPQNRHVEDFALSPDGTRVVYRADHETFGLQELFSLPLAAPELFVKLSGPLVAGGEVQPGFEISSDSAHVVYRADQEVDERAELFSAPIDGLAPPVRLHAPLAPDEEIGAFRIAPDGVRAVFTRRGNQIELYSAVLDGSAERLNPPLVAGGDVLSFELAGERVVYRADQDLDEVLELFSVPIDAHAPAIRVHAPLLPGRSVLPDFRVAPDQRFVAYLADVEQDECFELFRAPIDGSGPAVRASDPAVGGGAPVGDVLAALPAGDHVVYRADQDADEVFELFTVPRDGSRAPRRLHPTPVAGGDVSAFEASTNGARVLVTGDLETDGSSELYTAPADGSSAARKPVGPLVAGGAVLGAALSPDGAWLVYRADALRDEQVELFSVPLDAVSPPLRLDPAPHRNFGDVSWFTIAPDSLSVIYASDKDRRGRIELHRVPIDGSAPAVRLSAVTAPGGDVLAARFSPDAAVVVYRADQDLNDVEELYLVPADGGAAPVKLHEPLGGDLDVAEFELGSGRVVFALGPPGAKEILHAPLDGSTSGARYFPGPSRTIQFWLSPYGSVLFHTLRGASSEVLDAFSAPIDGSTSPVRIDGPFFRWAFDVFQPFFPDAESALFYRQYDDDRGTYRVRLDGSAAPVKLDDTAFPVELSADRSLLLLHGNNQWLGIEDVFVLPVDGSAAARRVSPHLETPPGVTWVRFAPDNDVLFLAERELRGARELYVSGSPFAPGTVQR